MKNELMVGTRLPAGLVRDLAKIENIEQTDRSSTVRKLLTRAVGEWKLDHFAEAYRNGQLSLARAAAEAGVSLWEMTAYARARKIPAQYDEDDLKDDLARMRARR